jgi:hypothetical protein
MATTPEPVRKTPEQHLREAVNNAAVAMVAEGFEAIDRAAEIGIDRLKKAILKGIIGRKAQ